MIRIITKSNVLMALLMYIETAVCAGGVSLFLLNISVQKSFAIVALSIILCTAFLVAFAANILNAGYAPFSWSEVSTIYGLGLLLGIAMLYEPDYFDTILVFPVVMGVIVGVVPAIAAHAAVLSLVFLWGGMSIELLLFYLIAGIVAAYISSCFTKKNQIFSGVIILFATFVLTMCVYVFFRTERIYFSLLINILLGGVLNVFAVYLATPYIYFTRNKEDRVLKKMLSPEYEIMDSMIKNKKKVYSHATYVAELAEDAATVLEADALLTKCSVYYYNYARTLGKKFIDPFIETAYWKKFPKRMVDNVVSIASEDSMSMSREATIVLMAETLVLAKEAKYGDKQPEEPYLNAIIRQKVNKGMLETSVLSIKDYTILKNHLITRLCTPKEMTETKENTEIKERIETKDVKND